jgi:hypothetical protein
MNFPRLLLALLTVFVGIWITDFLIHGLWLQSTYQASASLWRTEPEMHSRLGWLFAGEILAASMFVLLWAKGFASFGCLRCALIYGACMGLFNQSTTLITYAVQPFPADLAIKWFLAGVAQGMLMGVVVFFVYKPKV